MPFIPYLSFQGQCAEAFAFYGEVFGATPQTSPFSEAPPDTGMPELPSEQQGWLMHAQIDTPDGTLMGADMPPQFGGVPQAGVSISVSRGDEGAAQALFDRLADGGTGAIWKLVLATLVAYGAFLIVLVVAVPLRAWFLARGN